MPRDLRFALRRLARSPAFAAGALALSRLLSSLLFEVSPTDPPTFAAVLVVLSVVAVLAAALPARRAARTDPMIALRSE